MKLTGFPDHNATEKEKAGKAWGLQAAKAIWSDNRINGYYGMFYNNRETYAALLKYAMGQQEPDRAILGINPQNEKQSYVKGISWQVRDFISKRVNIVVEKLHNMDYDPIATAADPIAIERKEDLKYKLKAFITMQEFLSEVQQYIGQIAPPDGVDPNMIPQSTEELEVYMNINHKWRDEIFLEDGIKYHLKKNDWEHVKHMLDFSLFVFGVAAVYVGMDTSKMPVVSYIDPARLIVPTSEYPNYKDIPYGACLKEFTIAEFKKMAAGEFDDQTEKKIIEEFAKKRHDKIAYYTDIETYKERDDRDVDRIEVLHFEIKTTNKHTTVQMKDKFGNERFFQKGDDYYSTSQEMEKFKEKYGGSRKIDRKPYDCVYRGYWIVGSDYIFGYGRKYNDTGKIGYKIYAPNMRHNKVISPIEKMIPAADALERYDKKIQQIVSSAIPKGLRINTEALMNSAISIGTKKMSAKDILDMYVQTGILLVGSQPADPQIGGQSSPVEEMENGMAQDVVNYLQLMQFELQQLDEVIGMNAATAASTVHQETGKAVTQQMQMATEVSLGYLYKGDKFITQAVFDELGDLHHQAVRYNPEMFYGVFGQMHVERFRKAFSRHYYGIGIEARPTKYEWDEFYLSLREYVAKGVIGPEDELLIRRVENLKKAEAYLRAVIRKREKAAAEAESRNIEMNAQVQSQSLQAKGQMDMQLKQLEIQGEERKIMLTLQADEKRHQWALAEIEAKANTSGQWTIKQTEEKIEGDLDKATLQGQIDMEIEKMKAKEKAKEPKKSTTKST